MSDIPAIGIVGTWPTADAINHRITLSEQANGTVSPLRGMGDAFLRFGRQYGVHPGVVCAILQRESQLGCDGSILPTRCNNFSGITAGGGNSTCTAASGIAGREWAGFRDATAGLEGTFKLLNSDLYRSTGGTLEKVMEKYSPAFENDWGQMWLTFGAVGSNLGITITPQTNIYANGGNGPAPDTGNENGWLGPVTNWAVESVSHGLSRGVLIGVGIIGLYVGVKGLL